MRRRDAPLVSVCECYEERAWKKAARTGWLGVVIRWLGCWDWQAVVYWSGAREEAVSILDVWISRREHASTVCQCPPPFLVGSVPHHHGLSLHVAFPHAEQPGRTDETVGNVVCLARAETAMALQCCSEPKMSTQTHLRALGLLGVVLALPNPHCSSPSATLDRIASEGPGRPGKTTGPL